MPRNRIERRLTDIGALLAELRSQAAVGAEQLEQVRSEAEDARLRALVSEAPRDVRDHRETMRHAQTLEKDQQVVLKRIAELEHRQDELLDEFAAAENRA